MTIEKNTKDVNKFPTINYPERLHAGMGRNEIYQTIKDFYLAVEEAYSIGAINKWSHIQVDVHGAGFSELFSPIEEKFWQDVRENHLPLFPQYPVMGYFVDFGNPEFKVAVECDGWQWHQDKEKDRNRDQNLLSNGWTVMRIPGSICNQDINDVRGERLWSCIQDIKAALGMIPSDEFRPSFDGEKSIDIDDVGYAWLKKY